MSARSGFEGAGLRESYVANIETFKKVIPSRELTYPTLGKGKSSSKCHFWGIC